MVWLPEDVHLITIVELPAVTTTPAGEVLQVPEVFMVEALIVFPQAELTLPHLVRIWRVYAVFFRNPLRVNGAGPQLSTIVLSVGEAFSQYRSWY